MHRDSHRTQTRYVSLRQLAILLLILLGAAFTRIYAIDAQSFWIDEGFTWYLTQAPDPFLILRNDVHPPLYFLIADLWVALTGDSVLAMRFLSVLPSLVSIAVMVPLARELELLRGSNSGSLVPILAALMLALADAENFLAQDARSYTLQTTLILLSMWGMLRWSRRGGRSWLALWILSMAALVYTFYLAALVGVVQGIWVLLFLRGRKRIVGVGALIASALLVAPWLLLTLGQQSDNLSYADWIRLSRDGFGVIVDMVYRWFGRMWPLTLILALLALVQVDYSAHVWRIRWRRIASAVLLVMWVLLPVIVMFIVNERIPLYQPRRINLITGAIALLIAFGLGNIQRPARWLLITAIVIYGITTVDFWRDKLPWRTMAAETAPLMHEDAALMIELGGDDYAPLYHYTHALPDSMTVRGLTSWRKFQPETYEAGLPALIDAHNTIWFFYWGKDTSALEWLDELNFQRTHEITVDFNPDVYLWRYDRLPEEPLITYENGLVLHDAAYFSNLRADLIWSTTEALDADYTASIFLLNSDGQLVAQQDAPPDERPTSQWDNGTLVYDARQMQVLNPILPPGEYQVGVVVYHTEGDTLTRLLTEDGSDNVIIGTLQIE